MKKITITFLDCVWLLALAICTLMPVMEIQKTMLAAVALRLAIRYLAPGTGGGEW